MNVEVYISGKQLERFKNFESVHVSSIPSTYFFKLHVDLKEVDVIFMSDGNLKIQRYSSSPKAKS